MASTADIASTLIAKSKSLVNNDLKRICKEEGQIQSGNKTQLQQRVIQIINNALARNDTEAINRLRYRISNHGEAPPLSSNAPSTPVYADHGPSASANSYTMASGYGSQAFKSYQQSTAAANVLRIFKPSPFYAMQEMVVQNMVLETSPSHRQTANRSFVLSVDISSRMRADSTLKLLMFCAMEDPLQSYVLGRDVAFPSQIEVRVNNEDVKANFKGLKNKPGSTRPADITSLVHTTPAGQRNTIQVTYALTQKRYNVYVYLVQQRSIEELARQIKQRNVITKQSVINEMKKKASDPDIEVGSVNMSLKDAISTLRINIPCRSTVCTHYQCFDAESFLQLQEQAPTWQCPVCNKTVSFEALAVDQYVQEILDTVPKSTDQVTIEPDGQWHYGNTADNQLSRSNGYDNDDDDSDDLIEVSDYRVTAIKSEAVPTPISLARTPPLSSREASSAPRTGSKRTSEVIDLTLSDDDEPPRPAKKVAYRAPSSHPDPSRRHQLHSFGSTSVPMHPQPQSHNSMPSLPRYTLPPLDPPPDSNTYDAYGRYVLPPPPSRPYHGQGTSSYPTYLGSSP